MPDLPATQLRRPGGQGLELMVLLAALLATLVLTRGGAWRSGRGFRQPQRSGTGSFVTDRARSRFQQRSKTSDGNSP